MNLDSDNNYNLSDFVHDLLKLKFPNDYRKQQINDDDPDKLNFACPYCGDSLTDVSKKRGNIYLKSNSFKCFNDGCLTWAPLNKFVSKFAMEYKLPIPNIKDALNVEHGKVQITSRKGDLIEFLLNQKIRDVLLDFDDLAERFFLKKCSEAPVGSNIHNYIISRNLSDAPGFDASTYYDNKQDKLYIFNLDLRSGKVIGLSVRVILDGYNGPKYNIKNYSEFVRNRLISKIDNDILVKIDSINNFYNILNINFTEPIVITEGQINAMFMYNSIATTGVTKSKSLLGSLVSKDKARILFDNDKAGKTESLKLINQGYSVFMWTKLISDLNRAYPKYKKLISRINDVNDIYSFFINVNEKKTIDSFNTYMYEYFSTSEYDMIFL